MLDRLNEIKEIIDEKKKEKARLEGRLESLNDQLKQLGYKSVTEAKKALTKMKKQYKKSADIIEKKIADFEDKYEDLLEEEM